jgi:hypothetical protein
MGKFNSPNFCSSCSPYFEELDIKALCGLDSDWPSRVTCQKASTPFDNIIGTCILNKN